MAAAFLMGAILGALVGIVGTQDDTCRAALARVVEVTQRQHCYLLQIEEVLTPLYGPGWIGFWTPEEREENAAALVCEPDPLWPDVSVH